jgi:hypothetical protein
MMQPPQAPFSQPPPQQQFMQPPPLQQSMPMLSGTMDRRQDRQQPNPQPPTPNTLEAFSTPFGPLNRCLSCFRLDGYRPYFDVDTIHVGSRLKAAVTMFHLPDYFRTNVVGELGTTATATDDAGQGSTTAAFKGPDLYGPLWITLTLIFVLAATSNMVAYRHSRSSHHSYVPSSSTSNSTSYIPTTTSSLPFEYDLVYLLHAGSIVTTMAWVVPTLLCLASACVGLSNIPSWPMWLCVYGYSLTPYLPACLLLSILPWALWEWVCLGTATAASGLLVLRNLSGPLLLQQPSDEMHSVTGQAKATPILGSMLGCHVVFLIVLKVVFY